MLSLLSILRPHLSYLHRAKRSACFVARSNGWRMTGSALSAGSSTHLQQTLHPVLVSGYLLLRALDYILTWVFCRTSVGR